MSKMVRLKLKPAGGQASVAPDSSGAPHSAITAPSPATSTGGSLKLKLKNSQPPTPATEQPAFTASPAASTSDQKPKLQKKPTISLLNNSKKRDAGDDISPAAKRIASAGSASRKPSLKLKPGAFPQSSAASATPLSATKQLKLGGPKRQSTIKALTTYNAKRAIPDREMGVGYDSEDSEREADPAIQQGLILRMQPGPDADLLRNAIANNTIGDKSQKDNVDASIKFVTPDLRRAVVRVQTRKYAAAMVDLPCIVESMKSWDRKGWWKVADVCQMLLVLGEVKSDAEVRDYPLPREVNKENMQYAHGLTPPMHYVRKRRFRKRASHRQMENVEEEVDRLLKEDASWEQEHGHVEHREYTSAEWDREQNTSGQEAYDEEMDADGELMETTEDYDQQFAETPQEAEDDPELEAALAAEFEADIMSNAALATEVVTDSPIPLTDQGNSFAAVENAMAEASAAATPAETPIAETQEPMTQDEEESDEDESDEDEDEDGMDVEDQDAKLKAAEKQQQIEEVADIEREIAAGRAKANAMGNQLLKRRELDKLAKLESDLKMKKAAFGMDDEE